MIIDMIENKHSVSYLAAKARMSEAPSELAMRIIRLERRERELMSVKLALDCALEPIRRAEESGLSRVELEMRRANCVEHIRQLSARITDCLEPLP